MSPSIGSKRLSAPVHNSVCHFISIVPTSYKIMSKFIGFKGFINEIFTSFCFSTCFREKIRLQCDIIKSVADTDPVNTFLSLSLPWYPIDMFLWLVKITTDKPNPNPIVLIFFMFFYFFPLVNQIRKWDDHIQKRITFALAMRSLIDFEQCEKNINKNCGIWFIKSQTENRSPLNWLRT